MMIALGLDNGDPLGFSAPSRSLLRPILSSSTHLRAPVGCLYEARQNPAEDRHGEDCESAGDERL